MDFSGVQNGIGEERQQFGGPVLAWGKLEEFRGFINEAGGKASLDEFGVGHDLDQERNVGFDSANPELLQHPFHPGRGIAEPTASYGNFHE